MLVCHLNQPLDFGQRALVVLILEVVAGEVGKTIGIVIVQTLIHLVFEIIPMTTVAEVLRQISQMLRNFATKIGIIHL